MQKSLVGTEIDGFIIGQPVAEGGMGSVYQAFRPGSTEPFAIKILLPEYLEDHEYRQRFEREAALMQALQHPNIVPIRHFGEENGMMYFTMRLIRGPSLFDLLRKQQFTPAAAWQIINPVAQALDYAHQRNIVHRDIKPANVLIEPIHIAGTRVQQVYLADFGLSKISGLATLTQSGITLGTPHYMSPEQVMGAKLSAQSDVYSLAILTYEMLLGQLPFLASQPSQVALKQLKERPPRPSDLHPDFPSLLETVLLKALAKKPAERFASAGAFAVAFAAVLDRLPANVRERAYWIGEGSTEMPTLVNPPGPHGA